MNDDLPPPHNSGITLEEWEQTPQRVRVLFNELWEKVRQLQTTVEKLQEVVNRNSGNSSQPPSQDRLEQKPVKEKPSHPRKRGGQPRPRGHRRALVEPVDEIIHHNPVSCRHCGALLLGGDPSPYRHQVTELPCSQKTP